MISEFPSDFPHILNGIFDEFIYDISLYKVFQNDVQILEFVGGPQDVSSILNEARFCYDLCLSHVLKRKSAENLLIHSNSEPALPLDWMFLPLMHILEMDKTSAEEFLDDEINQDVKRVQTCLAFVSLSLLLCRDSNLSLWSSDVIYDKLMCVFMLSPHIFMDEAISSRCQHLFRRLFCENNFTLSNVTAFHEHFTSLLEHFEAESFGDAVFANFVLLPMCTRFDIKLRRAVWIEFTNVFKVSC